MTGDGSLLGVWGKALRTQWAVDAILPSAFVVAVPRPVRRRVGEFASHGTGIGIQRFAIRKPVFGDPGALTFETAVAHDHKNPSLLKCEANMSRKITGIERDGFHRELKFFLLTLEAFEVRFGIMDIARCDKGVGDEIVFGIHRSVVEIEKSTRLMVAHQEATVGIRFTDPCQRHFLVQFWACGRGL